MLLLVRMYQNSVCHNTYHIPKIFVCAVASPCHDQNGECTASVSYFIAKNDKRWWKIWSTKPLSKRYPVGDHPGWEQTQRTNHSAEIPTYPIEPFLRPVRYMATSGDDDAFHIGYDIPTANDGK